MCKKTKNEEVHYGIYDLQIEPLVEISVDTISLDAQAEEEYEREEREAIQSETYVPVETPRTLFMGVVPECDAQWEVVPHEEYVSKSRSWFGRITDRIRRFIKGIGEKK